VASQKDQIQSLIADINGLLNKASPRLPWVMANDTTHQRQILERVRNFLVSLQRRVAIDDSISQPRVRRDLMAHDIYYQQPTPTNDASSIDARQPEAAQQILQSVVQEMSYLRESLMQPLQDDVAALRQQREALTQEIRQLETQRQSYSLVQQQANQSHLTNEMLQAYLGRLQDNLSQQIAQALSPAQMQPTYAAEALPEGRSPALPAGDSLPLLHPAQRLEQAQLLQAQSDQMLMNLDSTLRTVFETLQRNVQGYEESLSQGVDRMHSLGQQGEMMFTALIGHLAQQLGREASSYLQQPAAVADLQTSVNPTALNQSTIGQSAFEGNRLKPSIEPPVVPPTIPQPPTTTAGVPPSIANLNLPFPGTELPPDQRTNLAAMGGITAVPNLNSNDEFTDLGLQDIDLEDLDLTEFGLDPADNQAIDALLNSDTYATDAGAVDETTLELSSPPSPAFSSQNDVLDTDPTDLDAALKLLEQLSSELQPGSSSATPPATNQPANLTRAATESDIDPNSIAEDTELEALYESLFGMESEAPEPTAADEAAIDEVPTDLDNSSTSLSDPLAGVLEQDEDAIRFEEIESFEEIETDNSWQDAALSFDPEEVSNPFDAEFLSDDRSEVILTDSAEEMPPEPFLDLAFESEADNAQLLAPIAEETPEVGDGWEEFLLAETVVDEPMAEAGESDLFDRTFAEPEATPIFDDPEITLDLSQPAPIDEIGSLTDLFVSEPDEIDLTAALSDIPIPQAESPVTPSQTPDSSTGLLSEAIDLEEPQSAPPSNSDLIDLTDLEEPQSAPPFNSASIPIDLTDLEEPQPAPPFNPSPAPTGLTEESYIPAAPEESLLPSDRPGSSEPNLWLDENTLSQLSQDLSRLEGMEGFELAMQEAPADESSESLDFGFADWGEADQQSIEAPMTSELELDEALLAELSAAPEETIAPTTPESPTDSEISDLFGAAAFPAEPALSASPFEQSEPKSGQEFGLTLEAMNDLFADLLTEESETSPSPTAQPLDELDSLTLDGLDSLLDDRPTPSSTPPAAVPPEVTLEGMENLFADAPTADAPPPSVTQTSQQSSETSTQDVTLDNAFGGLAEIPPAAPEAEPPVPPDNGADSQKKN
jgi:hypothetical protein